MEEKKERFKKNDFVKTWTNCPIKIIYQESTNRVSISKNDPLIKRTKFLMNMKSNP